MGVENPGRGVGRRGFRGCKGNEEVKEAFAPRFGDGVVILSEWGGGEGEQSVDPPRDA